MYFKLSLVTVEPVVFLCMISYHLNLVCLPQLLLDNICMRKYSNTTLCARMESGYAKDEYDKIQQQSAMWVSGSIGIMQAIVTLTLSTVGAVSDVIGKRKTLFICPISLLFENVFLLSIVLTGLDFPTWLLLLPNIAPAVSGGFTGLLVLAFAYISLITSESERTMRMTLVEATCFLSSFTATLSSGLVIERFGYMGTYALNIILQALSVLYLMFVLKPAAGVNHNEFDSQVDDRLCTDPPKEEARVTGVDLGGMAHNKTELTCPPDLIADEKEGLTNEESFGEDGKSICVAEKEGIVISDDKDDDDDDDDNDDDDANIDDTKAEKEALVSPDDEVRDHDGDGDDGVDDDDDGDGDDDDDVSSKITSNAEKNGHAPVNDEDCDLKSLRIAEKEALVPVDAYNDDDDDDVDKNYDHNHVLNTNKVDNSPKISKLKLKDMFNLARNFKTTISALKKLKHRKVSLPLLLTFFLCISAYVGELSIIVFYLKSKPFYLGGKSVGFFLAYKNGLVGFLGLVIFNWMLQKCFKLSEISILLLGCTACIVYQTLLGVANSTLMLCIIQVFNAMSALTLPTIRSFISKMVDPEAVGTVMGGTLLVECLATLISGIVVPFTYAGLLPFYSGATFFLLAAMMLVTLGIVLFCAYNFKKITQADRMEQNL